MTNKGFGPGPLHSPVRCSIDGALWHYAVVKPVWSSQKLKYLFSYHIMHIQCTYIHYSYVSTMQKAHSFDINLGFFCFFYTEWKVILINQRTTLLSLMSSTILGFKPSLCSLVRKHSTVRTTSFIKYYDESTLTKNTCRLFKIFKSNVACPYPPPTNQKTKKNLWYMIKACLFSNNIDVSKLLKL